MSPNIQLDFTNNSSLKYFNFNSDYKYLKTDSRNLNLSSQFESIDLQIKSFKCLAPLRKYCSSFNLINLCNFY